MTEEQMIEDLIKTLDSGIMRGVGHVNVEVEDSPENTRSVQTLGCSACARTPLNSRVPASSDSLKDFH